MPTSESGETMDKQLTYDMVRDHLMTQGEPSQVYDREEEATICRYRGDDGRMCAVGCLIPDELYRPELEGRIVRELPGDVLAAIGADSDEAIEFLRGLQMIHDLGGNQERWSVRLYDFALENGLRP